MSLDRMESYESDASPNTHHSWIKLEHDSNPLILLNSKNKKNSFRNSLTHPVQKEHRKVDFIVNKDQNEPICFDLYNLPLEIISNILSYFDHKMLHIISIVSCKMKNLAENQWKIKTIKKYPEVL